MLCPKCEAPVADGVKYCPVCGSKMPAVDLDAIVEKFKNALDSSEESTNVLDDSFDKTVVAEEFELTKQIADETTMIANNEPTAVFTDEPTKIDNETIHVSQSDPNATLIADVSHEDKNKEADKENSRHSKKKKAKLFTFVILSIVVVAAVIIAVIFGTGRLSLSGINKEKSTSPNEDPHYYYTTAKELIEAGEYAEAYRHLIQCIDYEDSHELINNFSFRVQAVQGFDKDGDYSYKRETDVDNKGKVLTQTTYDGSDEDDRAEYIYDDDGNLVMIKGFDRGNPNGVTEFVYDKNGKRVEIIDYDSDGLINSWKKLDKNGYEVSSVYYADGEIVNKSEYERDENGNCILEIEYNKSGEINHKTIREFDANDNVTYEAIYDSSGAITYENKNTYKYEFDAKGNCTLNACYDESGYLQYQYEREYRYDENGNVIYERVNYNTEGYFCNETREYVYDENQRITEEKYLCEEYEKETINQKWNYTYDDYNQFTSITGYENGEQIENETFEYEYNDNSIICHSSQYDKNGNVICEETTTYSEPNNYHEDGYLNFGY